MYAFSSREAGVRLWGKGGQAVMRRSSLFMLLGAVVLGILAVVFARVFVTPQGSSDAPTVADVPTSAAVVAAKNFAFGDKIEPDGLKVVRYPSAGIPAGTFKTVEEAIGDKSRVALRVIDQNELVTARAISGIGGRLSSSGVIGPAMRAVAVPINEVAGTGGFLAPGDRVDVLLTRTPDDSEEKDAKPRTDLLLQNVRVLGVGQDSNVAKEKAEIVKTATLEVTPVQAQKLALAASVGSITLSLRSVVDETRAPLPTMTVADLRDGAAPVRVIKARARPRPRRASPPPPLEVAIDRGSTKGLTSTAYPMKAS